ncbi:MAG: rhodanese-like domain-containing protein [Verrucomicrobia bacterium]|nr:rhodanese-like domain-containing protein [Verrucomicrobiota bacterium]
MRNLFTLICASALLLGGDKIHAQGKDAPSNKQSDQKVSVKNLDANEAEKLLKENKKVVVLDVRTPKEFSAGHIAGATNINFFDTDFAKKLAALDKSQPYLVHCAVGGRSAKARELMKTQQFRTIYHLEGGIKAWEKAGKPVER